MAVGRASGLTVGTAVGTDVGYRLPPPCGVCVGKIQLSLPEELEELSISYGAIHGANISQIDDPLSGDEVGEMLLSSIHGERISHMEYPLSDGCDG